MATPLTASAVPAPQYGTTRCLDPRRWKPDAGEIFLTNVVNLSFCSMRTDGGCSPVASTKPDFPSLLHPPSTELVILPYCCFFSFAAKLMEVLLVKGLETGSSSGWFVRGILGARDL